MLKFRQQAPHLHRHTLQRSDPFLILEVAVEYLQESVKGERNQPNR